MEKAGRARTWFLFCLLLILLYPPIFGHLEDLPLDEWDEGRLASSAYEMTKTGNLLVVTYDYSPEMWSTKPPMVIWMQAFFMKLLGPSLLAVRLPSALSAFFTCMLLFWFFVRRYGNAMLGFLSCIVLITCEGYVQRHGIRTGDYDPVLTLFTTSFLLFWFLYIEDAKRKYFYIAIVSLICAVLAKSVQPLLLLPAVFLYTIIRKKMFFVLKQKDIYIGIALFVLFVGSYYILREQYNPGYIQAVIANELGDRYTQVVEQHSGTIWYYHDFLSKTDFRGWYYLIPFGFVCGLASENIILRRVTLYVGLCAFLYLITLSFAATKLYWYELPALPLLSVLVAIFLSTVFGLVEKSNMKAPARVALFAIVFAFALPLYIAVYDKTMWGEKIDDSKQNRNMAHYMQRVLKGDFNIDGYQVAWKNHEQNIGWYIKVLKDKIGLTHKELDDLAPGKPAIVYQYEAQEFVEKNYSYKLLRTEFDNVKIYSITGRKEPGGN